MAAWQSNQSSTSSSSGAFSWRGSVSSSGDSPPHAVAGSVASRAATNASAIAAGSSGVGRKLKFRSATPSPPLMSGSAPAAYAGNLLARFRAASSSTTTTSVATIGPDDGIASDESISECDEGHSPSSSSQVRNRLSLSFVPVFLHVVVVVYIVQFDLLQEPKVVPRPIRSMLEPQKNPFLIFVLLFFFFRNEGEDNHDLPVHLPGLFYYDSQLRCHRISRPQFAFGVNFAVYNNLQTRV